MGTFGKHIITTYSNDNMGVRSNDGMISSNDDMHLLPFDGIANWERITIQLKKFYFTDILSFEIKNTYYLQDSLESFFKRAYQCSQKILSLLY